MTTKDQKKEAEEREAARAKNVKLTLESKLHVGSLGVNLGQSHYPAQVGSWGLESLQESYRNFMNSDEVQKERQEKNKNRAEQAQRMGVYGNVSPMSDADYSMVKINQIREIQEIATLDELLKYAKDLGAKLDFEVPEEFKKVQAKQLVYKMQSGEQLNAAEVDAFNLYRTIVEAYDMAAVENVLRQGNIYAGLNAKGKQIAEYYKPKEEKKK